MSIEGKHSYRFGYLKSEQWQNVRLEALAREKGFCQICGEESISNDAHHMWYPENIYETIADQLVILCRPCHEFLHAMVPECKTSDEQEGRAYWSRFYNAIRVWRQQKSPIFDVCPVTNAKDLREAYTDLKKRHRELEVLLIAYRRKNGEVDSISVEEQHKKEVMENFMEREEFIFKTLKKWAKAFNDKKTSVDNPVD